MNAVPPLVARFFDLLHRSGNSRTGVSRSAGLGVNVVSEWGRRSVPNINNFEAALNVLGYRLEIVPLTTPTTKENENDPQAEQ